MIKIRIRVKVRVRIGITFNISVYHWINNLSQEQISKMNTCVSCISTVSVFDDTKGNVRNTLPTVY